MKIEIINKKNEKKYPYIGISDVCNIVLFHKEGCGICLVSQDNEYAIGQYLNSWIEENFKSFDGEITISN